MGNNRFSDYLARGAVSARHASFLRRLRLRQINVAVAQIAIFVIFIGVWEGAARLRLVDPFITSSPTDILQKCLSLVEGGDLGRHTLVTVYETMLGFGIGTVLGLVIAGALWWWDFLSDVSEPYIVVLNATPKIALGPVFIVWLGASLSAVIALAISISLFVTILSIFSAFRQVDREKLLLITALGATKWQKFRMVVLPSAVPTIVSTLKVNIGLSLIGTIVGEFLAANAGLGSLIVYGQNIFDMSLVMTAVVLLTIIAGIMYYAIVVLERRFVRWQNE